MPIDRQKRLLALLDSLGGKESHRDFQKLLFLYCQEWEETPSYEFVPHRFGGFSITSHADKRKLIQGGFLAEEENIWKLTDEGRTAGSKTGLVRFKMDQFARKYTALRGEHLTAEAYRKHPWYAIRSEVADKILADDTRALDAIEASKPSPGRAGVSTIGYEGRSLENYLNKLLKDGVTLLCDVRRNPLSRKFGFSKQALSKGCESVGIRYEHIPQLGIDSEDRKDLRTQADYNALFDNYKKSSLPQQGASLQIIRTFVEQGNRVALTCYELLPEQCHRHCVAEALEQNFGRTYSPRHL